LPLKKGLSPEPVQNERALLIEEGDGKNVLIISDTHIGFEEELLNDGIYIPNQTKENLARVKRILETNKIERVVINGDLKHQVPKTPWKYRKRKLDMLVKEGEGKQDEIQRKIEQLMDRMKKADPGERKPLQMEFEELERKRNEFYRHKRVRKFGILEKSEIELKNVVLFLRGLLETVEVDIITGNHDGRVAKEMETSFPSLTSESTLRFHDSGGIVIGDSGIFHGHAWPSMEVMSQDYLIMGHGHAAILLTDGLGVKSYEHCWLRAPLTERVHEKYLDAHGEVILMPSFNDFFRGSPVNRKGRLLGPLFRNDYVDVDNGDVYLLDGVNLGKVAMLRRFAQRGGR